VSLDSLRESLKQVQYMRISEREERARERTERDDKHKDKNNKDSAQVNVGIDKIYSEVISLIENKLQRVKYGVNEDTPIDLSRMPKIKIRPHLLLSIATYLKDKQKI
jgi:vacuolar-type H+-ATPase subunit I/STV1